MENNHGQRIKEAKKKLRKTLQKKSASILNKYKKKRGRDWLRSYMKKPGENRRFWFLILEEIIQRGEIKDFLEDLPSCIEERIKKDQ